MEKNPSSKKYEKWEWGKEKLKWELLLKVISNIRQEKSIAKKSMKTPIVLTLEKKDKSALNEVLEDLKAVSTATLIQEGKFNVKFTEQDSK